MFITICSEVSLAMSGEDVQFSILLSAAVLILYLFSIIKIFAITFEVRLSARQQESVQNLCNTLIAVLTAHDRC